MLHMMCYKFLYCIV